MAWIELVGALLARPIVVALDFGRLATRTGDGRSCAPGDAAGLTNVFRRDRMHYVVGLTSKHNYFIFLLPTKE